MLNPFGSNGEIKKKEDNEPTIEGTGTITIKDEIKESFKEDIKVVDEKEKNEPARVIKSRKQQILQQYGGLESNVPVNSAYWKLKR